MSPTSPTASLTDEKSLSHNTSLKHKTPHSSFPNDEKDVHVKQVPLDGNEYDDDAIFNSHGDGEDEGGRVPERRQIGLFSAVFIIFNRIIGTG